MLCVKVEMLCLTKQPVNRQPAITGHDLRTCPQPTNIENVIGDGA